MKQSNKNKYEHCKDYICELRKDWENSIVRLSDRDLLRAFPEAKMMIPEKIKEWERKRKATVTRIKLKLEFINLTKEDRFSRWFWREWIKETEGQRLLEIDNQLSRLWRLKYVSKNRKPEGKITNEMIQRALDRSMVEIVGQYTKLKRSGDKYVGLCPLHDENLSSFYIYPTNSFYCFGCHQGGDLINFVRLKHGYTFKEAIKFLLNN